MGKSNFARTVLSLQVDTNKGSPLEAFRHFLKCVGCNSTSVPNVNVTVLGTRHKEVLLAIGLCFLIDSNVLGYELNVRNKALVRLFNVG